MPKGPSQQWRKLADHTTECLPIIRAALSQGYGKTADLKGIESLERAHRLRQGIYNAAAHSKVSAEAGTRRQGNEEPFATGDEMGIHKNPDGTYTLKFRVWDKRRARKHHVETNGTDRSQWAYNPFAKGGF